MMACQRSIAASIIVALWATVLAACALPIPPTASAPTSTLTIFSGTLTAEQWSLTVDSYCQGGSDYFTLTLGNQQVYALNSERDTPYAIDNATQRQELHQRFSLLSGQIISLRGTLITRTFEPSEHCPNSEAVCIQGPITCSWIRVAEIMAPNP